MKTVTRWLPPALAAVALLAVAHRASGPTRGSAAAPIEAMALSPAASEGEHQSEHCVAMETDARRPAGWRQLGRADPTTNITLTFALRHEEAAHATALEEALLRVSDPDSPEWGQHWDAEQVHAAVPPRAGAMDALAAHVARAGLAAPVAATAGGDYARVGPMSVAVAEQLLGTEYYEYAHADGMRRAVRAAPRARSEGFYCLPASLASMVDFVAPVATFPAVLRPSVLRRHKHGRVEEVKGADGVDWSQFFTDPSQLRDKYGISDLVNYSTTPATTSSVTGARRQAATGFLGEYFAQADLNSFFWRFAADMEGSEDVHVVGPDVANGRSGAGDEASLDVQYLSTVGTGIATEFWSFSGYAPDIPAINEPFLDLMLALNNATDPPRVVSTSYGEDEGSTSFAYDRRVQMEFVKAGLRGVSLLFASGDSGVGTMWTDNSGGGDGEGASCSHFTPQWPAASPYVTAVGATSGVSSKVTAASFSSGGFSSRWDCPAYARGVTGKWLHKNAETVGKYVAEGMLPHNITEAPGRPYPDVSAAGVDFVIVANGFVYTVDGTSASTPVFAGVVALLNDARASRGKRPLGFLNPLIYKHGGVVLDDIVGGSNPACGTDGFDAAEGWDPVTGFGSPNFRRLLELALSLP